MRLLTLRSMLVATDLEAGSGPALRTAARLARLAGAELHLLHVTSARTGDEEARLREHLARAAPDGPEPATVQVLPGVPAEVIVEQAVRLSPDVVILGPHRQGTGEVGEMGSTAASVVRTAPCSCLVAATELRLPLENVLAPIDISEAARDTLTVALSWASALRPRQGRARLTALHVASDPGTTSVRHAIHDEVEWARALAGEAAHVDVREMIAPGGDPAREILRQGASAPADLLVIGTRGVAGPASELGSVSAAVARGTPCPLLLVPPGAASRAAEGPETSSR